MTTDGTIYDETIKFGHGKLLASATVVNPVATIEFKNLMGDYSAYHLDCINLYSVTNAAELCVQVSDDNGANWAPNYQYAQNYCCHAGTTSGFFQSTSRFLSMSWGAQNTNPISAELLVFARGGNLGHMIAQSCDYAGGTYGQGSLIGVGNQISINAIRILMSTGNIGAGTVRMYGMKSGA